MPSPVIALGVRRAVRRWQDHQIVDEILDLPLPDCDELNSTIPWDQWEIGLSDAPVPPYSVWHAAYLLDPNTGTLFSYLNNTVGCSIAVGRLESSMKWMQALKGAVFPLVELTDAQMRTRFGLKRRPSFRIVEWRGQGGPTVGGPEPTPQIGHKVEEPSTKEVIDDEMPPWHDDPIPDFAPEPEAKPQAKRSKAKSKGS